MKDNNRDRIGKGYQALNNRAFEAILLLMHPYILWPKILEDGYIEGHNNLRDYWVNQWSKIYINIKPLTLKENAEDQVEATVHQIIKDNLGNVISDSILKHIYTFEDGLITLMEIQKL